MPGPNDVQLNPPESWERFEALCADLFAREWGDPNVVRYGRQGQRQHGVDIYGKEDGADVGAQCKKKTTWPVKKLTTADIDEEVAEAKNFRPKLTKFIIATTADNDVHIIDHANAISAKHAKRGLFSVHVYGWSEIIRRVRQHPDLLEAHFDIPVLRQMRDQLSNMPAAVAEAVRVTLSETSAQRSQEGSSAQSSTIEIGREGLAEALERDFAARLDRALKRGLFPEVLKADEFIPLAEALEVSGPVVSPALRRSILLRAVRAAALRGRHEDGKKFLAEAQKLSGPVSDPPARARLAAADGNVDEAIQLLRDETDQESRAVLFNIICTARGDDAALDWLKQEGLSVADLSPAGVLNLAQIWLRKDDILKAKAVLSDVTADQLAESPYLYFLRAAMRLASVFPVNERYLALGGPLIDVRNARPILDDAELAVELDAAANDFRQARPLVAALGLVEAPRLIEIYLTWCDLLHPTRRRAALEQLRRDMGTPSKAQMNVQFAFAYDRSFDPTQLISYLERRATLGGLSRDEFRSLIVIRINQGNVRQVADLIAKNRAAAEETFTKPVSVVIEVQALARAGDASSARIVLDQGRGEIEPSMVRMLEAQIAAAEGADPVAELQKVYEATKTTEALHALVGALAQKEDYTAIAPYAELLYAETQDRRDIALAARARLEIGDDENFARLYEAHPHIKSFDPAFIRHYAWLLFRRGRHREAQQVADDIARQHPNQRELNLEIAIALETGEWEKLAEPLAAFLAIKDRASGVSLISAANLAQASGQGPVMDLLDAAIARGGEDPHVLVGAYALLVEEGLEVERPEAHTWFGKALALSGKDGPVQQFDLKDLLAQQSQWNERTQEIGETVSRGDMPMIVASTGLRTTIVDVVLRHFVRNVGLVDGRRRVTIPLFSGRRAPAAFGKANSAAFDITALMVLGWLGLVTKAFDAFSKVILPAGVLAELFEGRRRIRQAQRSRLKQAEEVRDAIASKRMRVLRAPAIAREPLAVEIGVELAALLREAQATGGIVVRSAPVHRIGLEGDADLSAYQPQLADMHALLKVLTDLNVVDEDAERAAKQYFDLQDRGWAASAVPATAKPLFLDGLSVVYLQHTKLLPTVLRTFPNVFVHESTSEEAGILIEHDKHVAEVFRIIDDIRGAVRKTNAAGKVVFGPRRNTQEDGEPTRGIESTINLISDLCGAGVALCDDRFLNREPFVTDSTGHRAHMASTLDLIEELRARDALSEQERRSLRFRLRAGGAMLVPANAEEIAAAAIRNRHSASPEYRAIQDSMDLARLAEVPQFPSEIPWYLAFVHATKGAIAKVWNEEPDLARAAAIASSIFELHPLAEDWVGRWQRAPPPEWIAAVTRAMLGSLSLPVDVSDADKVAAYQSWLESAVMESVRTRSPETYRNVISYLREFIATPWEDRDGN